MTIHNPTCLSCRHHQRRTLRGQFFSMCWAGGKGKVAPLRICGKYESRPPVQGKLGVMA